MCFELIFNLNRKKKTPIPTRKKATVLIQQNNTFLVLKRNHQVFLGGMWEIPNYSLKKGADPEKTLRRELHKDLGLSVYTIKKLSDIKHTYTHFKPEMTLYHCQINAEGIDLKNSADSQWITIDKIVDFPFHKAIHKCFPAIKKNLINLSKQ